jgi:NAD(P)-dependent dehydrogenase (short-subunit alcohol dehydrogenase family)
MTDQLQPPQTQKRQPGRESEMDPRPDFMPRFPGAGRLKNKVALISGGDSGIGRAVAVAMAHDDARETVGLIEEEGHAGLAIPGDIGDEAFCRDAVAQMMERFGHVDVLVNNAAEQHEVDGLEALSAAQLERTFRTNVFGYVFLTKAALPHLKPGAAIINTTSVTAYNGHDTLLDYAATRGAIVAFTRALSTRYLKDGIRVNAVAPGPIWTPLIPASFDAEGVAEHGASAPMERAGQPNEVAPAYVFLASADASYMSGQVLHPNGGNIVGS